MKTNLAIALLLTSTSISDVNAFNKVKIIKKGPKAFNEFAYGLNSFAL